MFLIKMASKQNNDVALDLKKRETERGGNCFLDKKLCVLYRGSEIRRDMKVK